MAFVRPFDVMLIDEPFVGLDAPGREAMLDLLGEVHEDGAAVVFTQRGGHATEGGVVGRCGADPGLARQEHGPAAVGVE